MLKKREYFPAAIARPGITTSKGRGEERADYVLKPVNKYHENARKVLELGCRIGEVLANLPFI
jgi:hypothetical protein